MKKKAAKAKGKAKGKAKTKRKRSATKPRSARKSGAVKGVLLPSSRLGDGSVPVLSSTSL